MTPTDIQIAQLQQKYAQSQQLVDLLALQKLKSEKEAAARDLQLKMAQQQGAAGLPTIKDRLENEVMGMTKQEVAQQVTDVAQQRQQQQQQAVQQLAQSGIAQNEAPNMSFADGGIVAFAEGDYVENPYEFDPSAPGTSVATKKYRNALENTELSKFFDYLGSGIADIVTMPGQLAYDEEYFKKTGKLRRKSETQGLMPRSNKETVEARRAAERSAREKEIDQQAAAERAQFEKYLKQGPRLDTPRAGPQRQATDFAGIASMVSDLPSGKKPPVSSNDAVAKAGIEDAARKAASNLQSAPAGAPGITAALPNQTPAAPAGPTMPDGSDIRGTMVDEATGLARMDPAAAEMEREKRVMEALGISPEEMEVRNRYVEQGRNRLSQLEDPERTRREALLRGLMAASGGGGFAAVGTGIMNTEAQQRAAADAARKELEAREMDVFSAKREAAKAGIDAGGKRYGETIGAKEKGIDALAKTYGVDVNAVTSTLDRQSREVVAALDRQSREKVAAIQVAAQMQANQLQREFNNQIKSDSEYRRTLDAMNNAVADATKDVDKQITEISSMAKFGKLSEAAQDRLNKLNEAKQTIVDEIKKPYKVMLDKYNPVSGGTEGFNVLGVKPGT